MTDAYENKWTDAAGEEWQLIDHPHPNALGAKASVQARSTRTGEVRDLTKDERIWLAI